MTDKIVVLTTCSSKKQAKQIAQHLIETQVAACVNILPAARSFYRWKGKVEEAEERMLLIKSRRDLFESLRAAIEKLHAYEVPEIIALPVVEGSTPYLAWLDQSLLAHEETA
jgi:periplasmic divalent cation tolerance protein